MMVVTLSGVPRVGGSVTCGRTGCILAVTKTSLTRDVMMELLPTPSSPQTQIRTAVVLGEWWELRQALYVPVAILRQHGSEHAQDGSGR